MEPTATTACFRCERPALTFDDRERPLCGRHATIFVALARRASANTEGQEPRSEKASNADDPDSAATESGSHLRLVK